MSCGPGLFDFATSFNRVNPSVISWAEQNAARLVTNIAEDVRDGIRMLVVQSFEDGIPPREVARLLRQTIGLTPRDARAVLNRRAQLLQRGVRDVDRRVNAYANRLLRARAETIARTEAMRASNQGVVELWRQAEAQGLLTGRERKVWLVADPCPICAPLDGETVGIHESFSVGQDPPLHPRCRCTIGLVM
jgi:SPP1 gp7 family putative phage head morphogenesis protein